MYLPCPQPPDWKIDWGSLELLSWLQDMKGCPQNPERHAEGDVWTHVHLVAEAMVGLNAWRELPESQRRILFAAALLHDVAKPACTRIESDGRVTARGHSWRGAVRARNILWRLGVPFAEREAVCGIVRHHLVPYFLAGSDNPRRLAIEVSQTARCDWLAIMAEADVRGRICPDPDKLHDQIARFRDIASAMGCLAGPFQFGSELGRFLYFRDPLRQPDSPANEELRCDVVMLSGLPGAGKDHWLANNNLSWPVIGIDTIRHVPGNRSADAAGASLNQARALASEHLRGGRNFVWNAANLSRNVRGECVRLFHEFNARIRLVYVEVPAERLFAQNRRRRDRVPDRVVERMLDRWEVPDCTEAHAIEYVLD